MENNFYTGIYESGKIYKRAPVSEFQEGKTEMPGRLKDSSYFIIHGENSEDKSKIERFIGTCNHFGKNKSIEILKEKIQREFPNVRIFHSHKEFRKHYNQGTKEIINEFNKSMIPSLR